MQISASRLSQKTRGVNGGYGKFVLLDTLRDSETNEQVEALKGGCSAFDEAAKEVRRLEASTATRNMKQLYDDACKTGGRVPRTP